MFVHITPDELESEFKESWKLGFITQPSIDYADNAIYANFEGKLVIIFRFKDYGWINDNRFNTYKVTAGPAGITIQIIRNERNN
jgi:hypothetical protein